VRQPPRLLARTLTATVLTVAVILLVTFVVVMMDTRERVRRAEIDKLQISERVFTSLEQRDQMRQHAMMVTLAEHPRLKAALSTYTSENRFGGLPPELASQARATVAGEAEKMAQNIGADVLAILDTDGRVFAAAGPGAGPWRPGTAVLANAGAATLPDVVVLPFGAYRLTGALLYFSDGSMPVKDQVIGHLVMATRLDANYAQDLSRIANSGIVIVLNGTAIASMVPDPVARELAAGNAAGDTRTLNGEEYAVGSLLASGPARIYSLSSIDAAARPETRKAMTTLAEIAVSILALALLASAWLARTLTDPINRFAGAIAAMTTNRDYTKAIEITGTSRELDALAKAFNELMRGLVSAEAETRSAYLGAIRALAAALDARDPYTAGHSERVSTLSVLIARQMKLGEAQVDVIRLGALLHDVGKIGVRDEVLRKPGPLSSEEFEEIKRHPTLGARILRQVPFLAAHLPIVELHHEQPDGNGYPFGLRAEDIPLDARIVHVADAFDAMTSARAYRPARAASVALAELQRCVDTQFDAAVVEALAAGMPLASALAEPQLQELLGRGV
jgi:putative nucleotidyltransferase with HDIG domain